MRLYLKLAPIPVDAARNPVLINFLGQIALLNMVLCLFNLIPIYPLDGSHVLKEFLSREALETYDKLISPYGWIILLVLLNIGALGFIFDIGFRVMLLFVRDPLIWLRLMGAQTA
jgi:Zn-dependent protease